MPCRPRYPQGVSHTPTARRAVPWGHVRRPPFRTAVVLATLAVLAAVVVGFLDRFVAFNVQDGDIKVGLVTVAVILATLVLRPAGLLGKVAR